MSTNFSSKAGRTFDSMVDPDGSFPMVQCRLHQSESSLLYNLTFLGCFLEPSPTGVLNTGASSAIISTYQQYRLHQVVPM